MKISEMITDKYKLRIPPTVYYDLLGDVREVEEEQEPKTGHWILGGYDELYYICDRCKFIASEYYAKPKFHYCPNCGAKMVEPQESEG